MAPMNRRNFIAAGIATGVAAKAKGSGLTFPSLRKWQSGATVPSAASAVPSWLGNEPLVIAGAWDSFPMFQRRRGTDSVGYVEVYKKQSHEETLRKLKDAGVTLGIIDLFKGFGLVAEQEHIAEGRILAKRMKDNGIRVGLYIGATIFYETFLSEKPEAAEWFAPNFDGRPVYYSDQTFRRRVYFMHPGYREYIRRVIRVGVEQYDPDMFHFDNSALMALVPVMQHPMAVQDFRNYLRAKYTLPELTVRFGFADVRHMDSPQPVRPPVRINDPLFQEFADFRCYLLASYFEEMTTLIRSLNPQIGVDCNPHSGISGINTIWEQGVSYPRLARQVDFMWSEEGNAAGVSKDGVLLSKIRTMKEAAIYRKQIFCYTGDHSGQDTGGPLPMAESLAFNRQCLGDLGDFFSSAEMSPESKRYVQFFHENFDLYRDVESVADVALLYSEPSMAWNNDGPAVSFMLASQMLIQMKVPFDIVFDEHLQNLSKYRVLFLADQECLSEAQLKQIQAFVRNGGSLVATGDSSLYTEQRKRRPDFGLRDCFGMTARTESEPSRRAPKTSAHRNQFGKGRVAYLPAIEPAVPKPPAVAMRSQYWKLPLNQSEILSAIQWTMGGPFSVETPASLSPYVVIDLVEQKARNRRILHVVNYDCARNPSIENIAVSVAAPASGVVKAVRLLTPDGPATRSLKFAAEGHAVRFVLPSLNTYDLIAMEIG